MKCTYCGNTNLVKTHFPLKSFGDGGANVPDETEVYFCVECGHYEFFSPARIESYKNTLTWFRNTELEIEQLHKELEELQAPLTIQNIQDEINMLENQLKSLDITIRQQQDFSSRVHHLKNQLRVLPDRIKQKKEAIDRLQSALKNKKESFERGSF